MAVASEEIVFHAHRGQCIVCTDGVVIMPRDKITFQLLPNACYCLQCGKTYQVITDDIDAWELIQWRQKFTRAAEHS